MDAYNVTTAKWLIVNTRAKYQCKSLHLHIDSQLTDLVGESSSISTKWQQQNQNKHTRIEWIYGEHAEPSGDVTGCEFDAVTDFTRAAIQVKI